MESCPAQHPANSYVWITASMLRFQIVKRTHTHQNTHTHTHTHIQIHTHTRTHIRKKINKNMQNTLPLRAVFWHCGLLWTPRALLNQEVVDEARGGRGDRRLGNRSCYHWERGHSTCSSRFSWKKAGVTSSRTKK